MEIGYEPTCGLAPQQVLAHRQEVGGVDRPLEADQVAAGQAGGDLRAPRQAHEQLDRRERDVEEEPDQQIRPLVAQQLGDQLEVVVVDPDDGVVGRDLRQRVGEALVHRLVGRPVGGVVRGVAQGVVVQRPQRVVGEALVVVLHLVGRQVHRVQAHAVQEERLGVVVGLAGPPHPGPAGGPQERQQRPDQPPGLGVQPPADRVTGSRLAATDDRPGRARHPRRVDRSWPSSLGSRPLCAPAPARGRRRGRRPSRCRPTAARGVGGPRAANRPPRRGSSRPGARSGSRPRRATRPA